MSSDDDDEDTDCPECAVNGGAHRLTCSRYSQSNRSWTVERTWIVNAPSAREAFRKTAATDPDYGRTYEGPPRPWEAP